MGGTATGLWHSLRASRWQGRVLKLRPFGSTSCVLASNKLPTLEYEAQTLSSKKSCWEGISQVNQQLYVGGNINVVLAAVL